MLVEILHNAVVPCPFQERIYLGNNIILDNQHRISVAIESILLFNGLLIGIHY
jgi:hypothetical protein